MQQRMFVLFRFVHLQLLLRQLKSSRIGKDAEEEFKKIDEGYEGDQNEMTFKKSRKTKKEEESEEDTHVLVLYSVNHRWKKKSAMV